MLDFAWRKNRAERAYIYKKKKKKLYIHYPAKVYVNGGAGARLPPCNLRAQNPLISLPISSHTLIPRNVVFFQRKQALTTKSCPKKYPCNIRQHFKNADFPLKILRLQKSSCPKLKKCCKSYHHVPPRANICTTNERKKTCKTRKKVYSTHHRNNARGNKPTATNY